MKTAFTIIAYIVLLSLLLYGQRTYGIFSKVGMTRGNQVVVVLLVITFLFVLFEAVSERMAGRSKTYARKSCFALAFIVGGLWGVMGAFSSGSHDSVSPMIYILNFVVAGLLFGLLGIGVTELVYVLVRKENA